MNELINIENTGDFPVSGRELHEQLEPKTPYRIWFPRQIDGVFAEGEDFCTKMYESTGGRPAEEHDCTIGMAKEIAILQRTDKGLFVVKECFNEKTQWGGTQTLITPKGRETFRMLTEGMTA